MGKYSLVVVNNENKIEQTIDVPDLEKEYSAKVHIKDIDAFTSTFQGGFAFIRYLKEKGIINNSDVTFHIVSKFKGEKLHYKVIFNSNMIESVAKSVKAGYLDATKEGYREILTYFYKHTEETKFQESINNAPTINTTVKNLMGQYIEISNREKFQTEELEEERRLKLQIEEELKRYKTFRGVYLFIEQYKRYGFVKPYRKYDEQVDYLAYEQANMLAKTSGSVQHSIMTSDESKRGIFNVDDYNQEYDEFLEPEEYEKAYGTEDGYVYTKGVKHDKYTK